MQLYAQNFFFDYATRYRSNRDEIDLPETFTISTDEYELFKAFVESKDFEFKTSSEKAFDNLVKMAKREKYYDIASDEFNLLEEKLGHNNLKDLETFGEEIRQILTEEIVNRYYFQAGRILAQIQEDIQLDKAIEILNEPALVKEVLNGNQGALANAAQ